MRKYLNCSRASSDYFKATWASFTGLMQEPVTAGIKMDLFRKSLVGTKGPHAKGHTICDGDAGGRIRKDLIVYEAESNHRRPRRRSYKKLMLNDIESNNWCETEEGKMPMLSFQTGPDH